MDFEYFGLSRDLLYLCALLFGAAAAAFLVTLRKDCALRKKSFLITVTLCLSSLAIAALAVAVILSKGQVFTVRLTYPFLFVFFVLGGLALYFPRAGGCPILFAVSLFAVYICFSFLVYPSFREPERLVIRSSDTGLIFRCGAETWNIQNDYNQRMINFEAVSVTAYPAYPLIGGGRRGLITRVLRNEEELFSLSDNAKGLSGKFANSPGFERKDFTLDLPLGALPPGISLSVLFDGKLLYFDPPIHL